MSDKPVVKKSSSKTVVKEPASPKPPVVDTPAEDDIFSAAPENKTESTENSDAPATSNNDDTQMNDATNDNAAQAEVKEEKKGTKRQAEQKPAAESAEKKPKTPKLLKYIPWEYLTYDVLMKCTKIGDLFSATGKAGIVKIQFDYDIFAQECPECPPVSPAKTRVLYTNHPLLKSAFGFSPYTDEEGKVSNQLRFEFDDFIGEEGKKFKKHIIEHWNRFCIDAILKNKGKFPEKYLESRCKVEKGATLAEADVKRAWKSIVRESEKSSFADYIQFKLDTPRENPKAKVKVEVDPYTAFLQVWSYQYYDSEGNVTTDTESGKRRCLAKKLTEVNSTDYEGEDAQVIFDKGMYGEGKNFVLDSTKSAGMITWEHLNFPKDSLGLTMMATVEVIARKEDIGSTGSEGQDEEECPM